MIENNPRLRNLKITFKSGTTANIYIRNNGLNRDSLNEFFKGSSNTANTTIDIKATKVMNTCDQNIQTEN